MPAELPLLSICVPAYNRPRQLLELVRSVDCAPDDVEIVICEDRSPKQAEIRAAVEAEAHRSPYRIRYSENAENLGYDGNIRHLVETASGKYVLFLGDDDLFVPGALDRFLGFLAEHADARYVLRSYIVKHENGAVETFRYKGETTALPPGEETVAWLFKRSVTICGFTIERAEALKHSTADLDGTLLYQIYLMAEVCLQHPSVYCDFPVAEAVQSYRDDKPMFGASKAEQGRYAPGSVSEDNSINFTKSYFEVTAYLDRKHGTHLTERVRESLSKYSYPFLSIQRKRGIGPFLHYARRLDQECGLGQTPYFHLYKWGLVVLGEANCDRLIRVIKRASPQTPEL
jgi:glycosyltransferase involved in cell wall biosynthesis